MDINMADVVRFQLIMEIIISDLITLKHYPTWAELGQVWPHDISNQITLFLIDNGDVRLTNTDQ